jgi:hypothetical protein
MHVPLTALLYHHVWRREGEAVYRATEEASRVAGPSGAVRLQSSLRGKDLPGKPVGHGSVDVETEDGQLVGRVSFEVTDMVTPARAIVPGKQPRRG